MAKISVASFNTDIRKPLGAVLTSGNTYWASGDAQFATRFQYGYGVPLTQTVGVTTADNVDDIEWDNVRLDLIKARTHQKGLAWVTTNLGLQDDRTGANNANDVTTGDKVLSSVYTKYVTVASNIVTDRFLVAANEFEDVTPALLDGVQTPVTFSTSATWQTTIYWSNAAAANAFFNAGGSFSVGIEASPGSLIGNFKLQSDAMYDLLMPGGNPRTVTFGATEWYTYASTGGVLWTSASVASGAYTADKIEIRVLTNTGTIGSSSRLTLRVTLVSGYAGGQPSGSGAGAIAFGDQISLLLTPLVSERHSVGTITSPLPIDYDYGNWTVI